MLTIGTARGAYSRRLTLLVVAAFLTGCHQEPEARPGNASALAAADARPTDTSRALVADTALQPAALCPTPAGGLRIGLDSVAGMPAGLSAAELLRRCPSARVDAVELAGFGSPAVRFDFEGATIWAQQNVPDTDVLVPDQPAEAWIAVGDSLRFADGRLIPRRLGEIRAIDSVGVMSISSGDDSEGADVVLCRVPGLSFLFDTLPAPADARVRPFAGMPRDAATPYRRVEQRRDTLIIRNVQRLCSRVGAT